MQRLCPAPLMPPYGLGAVGRDRSRLGGPKEEHWSPPAPHTGQKAEAWALILGCQWPLTCLLARMYTFSFSIFT